MLKSILTVFLAIVSFFGNISGALQTPKPVSDGGERIQYADSYNQIMDVYIPKNASGTVNVVLLIHGGAWMFGDQSEYSSYAKQIADDYGYVGVSMDYRKMINNATCEDMINDVYTATESIAKVMEGKGLTPGKMAVIGHSAGAHLAVLYSYTHYSDSPIEIGFVMGNSTPSDFMTKYNGNTTFEKFNYLLVSCMLHNPVTPLNKSDCATELKSISPCDNVTADVPPTILVHGAKDSMVPYENSVALYEKLQSLGVDSTFITYPTSDHFLETDDEMDAVRSDAFFEYAEKYF